MSFVRDYDAWHNRYDDPDSDLSWRLRTVQRYIIGAVDRSSGPLTILSNCAGDGRDLLGVLARRDDAHRFRLTLIELHPVLADRARSTAAAPNAGRDRRSSQYRRRNDRRVCRNGTGRLGSAGRDLRQHQPR